VKQDDNSLADQLVVTLPEWNNDEDKPCLGLSANDKVGTWWAGSCQRASPQELC